MNIVLFTEAILQLCRINRVLNIPAGHLLLIGEGGTGRNSLTRLSAFINEFRVFEKNRSEDKLA
jgi:dynein heavy chain